MGHNFGTNPTSNARLCGRSSLGFHANSSGGTVPCGKLGLPCLNQGDVPSTQGHCDGNIISIIYKWRIFHCHAWLPEGTCLVPKFWLFTVEDISDFWLSTWEDMVIYGNIKSESFWTIGTLRTHWKHLEWDHWNLELHLWPLEPKFGAPFFWGTGNGRAPYVDWELAMGDDWSDLMSNATRLLIRLQTIRLKWWVCRKYGKGIAYKISMFNTSNHLYWKHGVSIVGWQCNAVAEHEIAPGILQFSPSLGWSAADLCHFQITWLVQLVSMIVASGLNDSGDIIRIINGSFYLISPWLMINGPLYLIHNHGDIRHVV